MKPVLLAAAFLALAAGAAQAAEQGTLNQAGPYEATLQFYLHPAHGFPGKSEAAQPAAKAEGDDGKTRLEAKPAEPRQTIARARVRKAG